VTNWIFLPVCIVELCLDDCWSTLASSQGCGVLLLCCANDESQGDCCMHCTRF